MIEKIFTYKLFLAFLLGAVLVYGVATMVVNQRLAQLQLETQLLISDQATLLAAIAETTARSGGDAVTERIIKDCPFPERARFDTLLGRLNTGLTRTELIELERLFGRCGNFFAERKAVMVARLEREVQIYETFVNQLNNLTGSNNLPQYQVADWQALVELENQQSRLYSELVEIQDQIITSLLTGNAPSSEAVATILQTAAEIQETLLVSTAQAKEVRSRLVSL
jgi:hypothetical protein